jgi:hypothetical protein
MFGDRDAMRRAFADAWKRRQAGEALEPLAAQLAAVIEEHPEYQGLLGNSEQTRQAEFPPELGGTNPFLHMGMHLAIRDQRATDRPSGFAGLHARLSLRYGVHEAEHRIMECLGAALWEAQRSGAMPDEIAYLECVQRLASQL